MADKQRYLIDANVVLEVIFAQERVEESFLFLERVAQGDLQAKISSLALHSIAILAVRDKLFDELGQFLDSLSTFHGLTVHYPGLDEEKEAVETAKKFSLDFEDALQYTVAKANNLVLVSFDKDFDKTDLVRVEPKSLLI